MSNSLDRKFYLLLILTPIIDFVSGIQIYLFKSLGESFSIGIMVRFVILFFILFEIIKFKSGVIYVIFSFLYFIIQQSVLINFFGYTASDFFSDSTIFFKQFYIISLLFFCYLNYKKLSNKGIVRGLIIVVFFISISLILTKMLDLGISTYGVAGHKGFFTEQNAIANIFIGIIPLVLLEYFKTSKLKYLLIYLMVAVSSVMLGTRAAILMLLIETVICVLFFGSKLSLRIVFSLLATIAVYVFFEFYWVEFRDTVIVRYRYFLEQLDITSFIFSMRNDNLLISKEIFLSNPIFLFLGSGYQLRGKAYIEMDLFDYLFSYGLIVWLFVYTMLLMPIIKLIRNYKTFFTNKEIPFYLLSLISMLVFSSISGHVLSTPLSGTILCALWVLVAKVSENKQLTI